MRGENERKREGSRHELGGGRARVERGKVAGESQAEMEVKKGREAEKKRWRKWERRSESWRWKTGRREEKRRGEHLQWMKTLVPSCFMVT